MNPGQRLWTEDVFYFFGPSWVLTLPAFNLPRKLLKSWKKRITFEARSWLFRSFAVIIVFVRFQTVKFEGSRRGRSQSRRIGWWKWSVLFVSGFAGVSGEFVFADLFWTFPGVFLQLFQKLKNSIGCILRWRCWHLAKWLTGSQKESLARIIPAGTFCEVPCSRYRLSFVSVARCFYCWQLPWPEMNKLLFTTSI